MVKELLVTECPILEWYRMVSLEQRNRRFREVQTHLTRSPQSFVTFNP